MLKKNQLALLILIALGFALCIHNVSFQPLWGDEGWSFYFASYPITELIALTAADIHPPLYYILLKAWLTVMGTQPETARLFSAFIGTLLIPVMYRLARHYGSYRLGLITVAITTTMPMAIYYAQEVRMYGLVTLLGAISMLTFAQLLHLQGLKNLAGVTRPARSLRPCRSTIILYILSTTAMLHTMYYAVFLLVAQILVGLYYSKNLPPPNLPRHQGRSRFTLPLNVGGTEGSRIFMSWLTITLLYLPWLIYATPRLLNYIQHKRDVEGYLPLTPWHFLHDHALAFTLGHVLPQSDYLSLLLTIPFVIIMFIGCKSLYTQSKLCDSVLTSHLSLLTSHFSLLTSYL